MALKKKVIKKKPVRTVKLQPKETPETPDVTTSVKDVPTCYITTDKDHLTSIPALQNHITNIDCKIKFVQTHPDANLPTKAHSCDNCWDLYAVEDVVIPGCRGISRSGVVSSVDIGSAIVDVGIILADITPGFGFVFKPRSGLGFKHGIYPHQGEIDNGYRGGLAVKMYNFTGIPYEIKKGDKICQFKVEKVYQTVVEFTDTIVEAARGANGFGSSGK
jgi:dUTP pyrophosphatase